MIRFEEPIRLGEEPIRQKSSPTAWRDSCGWLFTGYELPLDYHLGERFLSAGQCKEIRYRMGGMTFGVTRGMIRRDVIHRYGKLAGLTHYISMHILPSKQDVDSELIRDCDVHLTFVPIDPDLKFHEVTQKIKFPLK